MAQPNQGPTDDNPTGFTAALVGTAILGAAAVGLSFLLNTPLGPQFTLSINDALIGVIATAPPVLFLLWFSNTSNKTLAEFRRSQIKFFAEMGFEFTPMRILAMAAAAGLCEELLFRGVLQSWISGFAPVIVAILVSNVVFGALHMRTLLYAVIAGGVGVYFGALYALNGNLLTPIVAHAFYDAIALEYTRRAIVKWRNSAAQSESA